MMREQENVRVVQQMFAAIEQGNIPVALNILAEDVDWQSPVTRTKPREVSWAKPRHGREEVAKFFKELSEKMQIERMEVLEFTAQGDCVVVEGKNRGTVKSTGRTYEHDWVMVFTVRGGKIVRHRHYYDTADILVAFCSE
jgi:ketosteroid isomerase-like protein